MTNTAAQQAFTQSYLVTALWSSLDDNDKPLDASYTLDDIAPETRARLEREAVTFYEACEALILDDAAPLANDLSEGSDDERKAAMAGHDFWLTRNGHGAGFWDGDWPEAIADTLTQTSETFGEVDLFPGDDGRLYTS